MKRSICGSPIALLALMLVVVAGCNRYDDKVIGTWDTDMPGNPRFTIEKDGSGSLTGQAMGQPITKSFRWRLKGSNLIFNIDGKDLGGVIKSADADKFVLNDPDVNRNITFTRVK